MGEIIILNNDCRIALKALDSESVNCCVTSPPYFGLRDYGVDGQIGLETSIDEYVAHLVNVFREIRRILRNDGTLWLNIGDSYAGYGKGAWDIPDDEKKRRGVKETYSPRKNPVVGRQADFKVERGKGLDRRFGLKNKELMGIPWRVAFALQSDGWYLRQDIIWHKPNAMPESVTDRCTKSHEYLFLFSKSPKYYFDSDAIKESAVGNPSGNKARKLRPNTDVLNIGNQAGSIPWDGAEKRNRRSVWSVTTKPFKGAHFAVFPEELITPCIMAGCPRNGVVIDPFMGSGTTAVVAKATERSCIGVELNPEYVSIINQRLAPRETIYEKVIKQWVR